MDGLDFEVLKGEFFSLLGPNGAGKTTTISILATILKPTSGSVFIDGLDVEKEPHLVRQKIGVIFQDPSLDDRLSALENMDFHGRLYGMSSAQRLERSRFMLSMVDLWERRKDLVRTYSGGMRRRLEIARGLMHFPRLLILDEPTIGLDPSTRRSIWEYIHLARKDWEMTVLLTTHYLEEAESADRVAIMNDGRFVALDTPFNLKRQIGPEIVVLESGTDMVEAIKSFLSENFGVMEFHEEFSGCISFPLPKDVNNAVYVLQKIPFPLQSMTVRTPDLDDVFIQLTGKGVSDNNDPASPFHRVYRGK
ncbi:MAG: ATP-binding cassette domain-containing protein [Leptospirales bacterium]